MNIQKEIFSFLLILGIFVGFGGFAFAMTPEELRQSIENKSKELLEINTQIHETQKNLNAAGAKSKTLDQEIKKYDYLISQINLGVKSSEIKIDKLRLEIEDLSYEISEKEQAIEIKKKAIAGFLRELQEKDQQTTLLIFLRSQSLADSIAEAQSIDDLNRGLSEEIALLGNLRSELKDRLASTASKKAGVETEAANLKYKKSISEEQKQERKELLTATKSQEKAYLTQLEKLEKQQAEIASEIESIEKELRAKIDPNLIPIPRPGVFEWPAEATYLSQGYGATSFAAYSYKGKYHNGVDIAGPIGTPILAAESGSVVFIENQDSYCPKGAYGRVAVIRHQNGLTTLYAHLSKIIVKEGDQVTRGQVIGYMGKTGYATGPHLHFTVWQSTTFAVRTSRSCGPMPVGGDVNPLDYLATPRNI